MFEAAELNQSLSSRRCAAKLPALRTGLLQAHFDLWSRRSPVIVIVLGADGAEWVTFCFHPPKAEQRNRLKKPEAEGRIGPEDWNYFKGFDRFTKVPVRTLQHTDTGVAPWRVIEATDPAVSRIRCGPDSGGGVTAAHERERARASVGKRRGGAEPAGLGCVRQTVRCHLHSADHRSASGGGVVAGTMPP